MRIAIFSDIHGNDLAFSAVLADLANKQIDQYVCLGDVFVFGPQPLAVLSRLQALNCPVVTGNTDAWALSPQPHALRDEQTQFFNAIELWSTAQLTADMRPFVTSFQATIKLSLPDDNSLLCYHGSPRSFYDAIFATTPDETLQPWFAGVNATFGAGGHTHRPYQRAFASMTLFNPGAVGLPLQLERASGKMVHPAWAEYAILTLSSQQQSIELCTVPYSLAELKAVVRSSEMPYYDWWLANWVAA